MRDEILANPNDAIYDRATTLPASNTRNTGQVFALSVTEAVRYLPTQAGTGCNTRQAQREDTDANVYWWVRSPGGSTGNTVTFVVNDGSLGARGSTDTDRGFRSVLWIRP